MACDVLPVAMFYEISSKNVFSSSWTKCQVCRALLISSYEIVSEKKDFIHAFPPLLRLHMLSTFNIKDERTRRRGEGRISLSLLRRMWSLKKMRQHQTTSHWFRWGMVQKMLTKVLSLTPLSDQKQKNDHRCLLLVWSFENKFNLNTFNCQGRKGIIKSDTPVVA